ncbi:MAG TPA: MBL fold metallo-hydrolase [Candidatus Acidoferrum sp.]|jgi:7,8-dihydropterin-6-yl-methyl-4-(beta-D-ribofuranosyl)aminobenzene 5'-phosphate synthase|nr:MBL fold metallo-hydrolase [Candidatus Acidoferrum sp.]
MHLPRRLLLFALFALFIAHPFPAIAKDRITILYDAFSDSKDVTRDWGFSALVEHGDKRILFDTGNNAAIFEHNVKALGVDLTQLDFVVISHRHADHSTGLKYVLKVNPAVTVYAPKEGSSQFGGTFPQAFLRPAPSLPAKMRYFDGNYPDKLPVGQLYEGGEFILIDTLTEVAPGIFLVPTISKNPGTLELHELTLAIRGPQGLTLVDGCSHSGIEEILQAATAIDSHFHILFGGLHLVTTPEDQIDLLVPNLKNKWKLEKIAPGHCTGEAAFLRLQKAYGENYYYAGAGTRLDVP